jgi:L-lactate dehydrogenase complex protein LldG
VAQAIARVIDARVERFMALARAESATATRVAARADVPMAVLEYLREQDLGSRLVVIGMPEDDARAIDWAGVPELDCVPGPVNRDGDTVATGCYAGIAEAGALVVLSSGDHPTEVNFLAATHIVIVSAETIVESFEDLWSRLHADFGNELPRSMNFIVGPSRTADLGVPSKLGAHGPARVHIVVVGS